MPSSWSAVTPSRPTTSRGPPASATGPRSLPESTPLPGRPGILQLDSHRTELGRNYPAEIALQAGIRPTIRALTRLTAGHCPEAEARIAAAKSEHGDRSRPTAPPPSSGERMDAT